MKNTHDFPVELVPIYTHDANPQAVGEPEYAEAPKRFAVQRQDNRDVLGVVTDKYRLLPHAVVVDGFRKALEKGGYRFEERIQVTKGGAHMFATYSFPELTIRVGKDDEIALQFTVKNSYDGGTSLNIVLGAFRLVCSNGMIIGKRFLGFKWRHTGDVENINVEQLEGKVKVLAASFQDSLPAMQAMAATRVSEEQLKALFDTDTSPLPEYLVKEAAASFSRERDKSWWGAYNAMTYAITHRMRRESPQAAINYGRIAWEVARKGAEAAAV